MQSKKQRQFKGTSKPRTFFDRFVRRVGGTAYIALGKLIPNDYYFVRTEVIDRDENSVTIKVTKLLEISNNASNSTNHKTSKQDT